MTWLEFPRVNNQTTDVLVEDQLLPPLDLMTVCQERELHKPHSRTERGPFVLLITQLLILQHMRSLLDSDCKTPGE